MTIIWTGRSMNHHSNPGRGTIIFSYPQWPVLLWGPSKEEWVFLTRVESKSGSAPSSVRLKMSGLPAPLFNTYARRGTYFSTMKAFPLALNFHLHFFIFSCH